MSAIPINPRGTQSKPESATSPRLRLEPTPVRSEEHVFLIGRPPLAQFLDFIALSMGGGPIDRRALADEWRSAHDHIQELERQESGIADRPPIAPLPPTLARLEPLVHADPAFQQAFQVLPTEIGVVELDRLVVYQKHINLEHVRRLQNAVGPTPDEAAVFRFCLPYEHPTPPVRMLRTAPNAVTFISPSNDLRLLDITVFRHDQISDYRSKGPIAGAVAVVVGYGSNYLQAVHSNDRLILHNGSHRAYALRDLGLTHVPCLIQRVTRPGELEFVAHQEVQANLDAYIKGPRPPLLRDYFDPQLRKVVAVPARDHQVTVNLGMQQADIPAA